MTTINLTVHNVPLPRELITHTPSMQGGLSPLAESDCRMAGCALIWEAGILLELPQVTIAAAQILLQRYYYRKSLLQYDFKTTAVACLYLAAKVEETPTRIRNVVNSYLQILCRARGVPFTMIDLSCNLYFELRDAIIKAERRVLKELGFCVHIQQPHKLIISYLKVLNLDDNLPLTQLSWNYMNDGFRSNIFCVYQPHTIAAAVIYLSTLQLQIPFPALPWWLLFDAPLQDIHDICKTILALYQRVVPSLEELDALITAHTTLPLARPIPDILALLRPLIPASQPRNEPAEDGTKLGGDEKRSVSRKSKADARKKCREQNSRQYGEKWRRKH
eukprot:Sdes_comp17600_c0_seq1m6850